METFSFEALGGGARVLVKWIQAFVFQVMAIQLDSRGQ